jgi:hypothetical protein
MSAPEAIMRTVAKAAPADRTAKPSTINANPQARRVMHPACDPWLELQGWSTLRQGSFFRWRLLGTLENGGFLAPRRLQRPLSPFRIRTPEKQTPGGNDDAA